MYHGLHVVVQTKQVICIIDVQRVVSDSPFRPLSTDASWAEARSASEDQPVLVFKHSSACPVSAKAETQLQPLAEDSTLPVYKLVVQESRALSDEIAETLGIRHETPQAIVLDDGTPVFDASHFDVTTDAVRGAVQSAPSSTN